MMKAAVVTLSDKGFRKEAGRQKRRTGAADVKGSRV